MSKKPSIFIDGEAGTTGLQIRDRLKGRTDLELVSIDPARRKDASARKELLNSVDVAILCLPDDAAIEAVSLIEAGSKTRVIDASTAFRTNPGWAYGFPELDHHQATRIANASRVANPGCWPQGFIALIKPLVMAGLLSKDVGLSYGGISGYSGGGKKMIEDYEAKGQRASHFMPYGLTFNHKHLPEMKYYAGLNRDVIFQPVVGNFAQGMLTSVPLHLNLLKGGANAALIQQALETYYHGQRFVSVAPLAGLERAPELDPQVLNNTNNMRLHVFANEARGQAVLMSIYDNLGKGASGAAVQNLNLMIGADEAASVNLAA
jgi:N-acetyl-gamma-glutamyl-phosphate reductase